MKSYSSGEIFSTLVLILFRHFLGSDLKIALSFFLCSGSPRRNSPISFAAFKSFSPFSFFFFHLLYAIDFLSLYLFTSQYSLEFFLPFFYHPDLRLNFFSVLYLIFDFIDIRGRWFPDILRADSFLLPEGQIGIFMSVDLLNREILHTPEQSSHPIRSKVATHSGAK